MKDGIFGTSSTAAADPQAISRRKAHGVLMAVNFIVILPLGALAARQLRCHWIKNPRIRASLFYVHIILQVRLFESVGSCKDSTAWTMYCSEVVVMQTAVYTYLYNSVSHRRHKLRADRTLCGRFLWLSLCSAQVTGVACATAGFVIATKWFGVPYALVQYNHGKMGIAILTLVYSQVTVVGAGGL